MKFKYILLLAAVATSVIFSSCIDQDMNNNPNSAPFNLIKPEWFLNKSIVEAQMDEMLAPNINSLIWKEASRQSRPEGYFATGNYEDRFPDQYDGLDYGIPMWIQAAVLSIRRVDEAEKDGTIQSFPYYKNVKAMARIWRAHLLTQFADNFGPTPIESFNEDNPTYESVQRTYHYALKELEEAVAALDEKIDMSAMEADSDPFYGVDRKTEVNMWKRFGNSLRMRLAMRLSRVEPGYAKTQFETAAQGIAIDDISNMAQVQCQGTWNPYFNPLAGPFDDFNLSPTMFNLTVGLGGQAYDPARVPKSTGPKDAKVYLRDPDYLGMKYNASDDESKGQYVYPTKTNDPGAGYFFDGIPAKVDPRMVVMFSIPGFKDDRFPTILSKLPTDSLVKIENKSGYSVTVQTKYTWNTAVGGEWGNQIIHKQFTDKTPQNMPAVSQILRADNAWQVFFGPWEVDFLKAEARLYHWTWTGAKSDEEYYNDGIRSNFDYCEQYYHMQKGLADAYINSTDRNRLGTSVKYDDVSSTQNETVVMHYHDYNSTTLKDIVYKYPVNTVYKGANSTNNDKLVKIITQKYLSEMPWQPIEAWNDQRRLGLPFFENQAVESAYTGIELPLTPEKAKECNWQFYPQRLPYPVAMENNPDGYKAAQNWLQKESNGVSLPKKVDASTTPLYWSGEANQDKPIVF